jgi:hypothetical protein
MVVLFCPTTMRRLSGLANISFAILALQLSQVYGIYVPLREYAGSTFFDEWDYWGNVDNTTWGAFLSCLSFLFSSLMT